MEKTKKPTVEGVKKKVDAALKVQEAAQKVTLIVCKDAKEILKAVDKTLASVPESVQTNEQVKTSLILLEQAIKLRFDKFRLDFSARVTDDFLEDPNAALAKANNPNA